MLRTFVCPGFLLAIVAVVASPRFAVGETITFQQGADVVSSDGTVNINAYAGCQDAGLQSRFPTTNTGASGSFNVGKWTSGGVDYVYNASMRFDLTAMAGKYSSIESLKLRLYVLGSNSSEELAYGARVAADSQWVEGTLSSGAEVGSVCYNYQQYNDSDAAAVKWANGGTNGGRDTSQDVYGVQYYNSGLASVSVGTWVELSIDPSAYTTKQSGDNAPTTATALVDKWIAAGAANAGLWIDYGNTAAVSFANLQFASAQNSTLEHRPQLVVEYSTTPAPEPSTLFLAAAGAIGILFHSWRKRR